MSVLFAEGFDDISGASGTGPDSDLGDIFDDVTGNGSRALDIDGRFGGGHMRIDQASSVVKVIAPSATVIVGFAFFEAQLDNADLVQFESETGSQHCRIKNDTPGLIQIIDANNSLVATATVAFTPQTWNFLEIKLTVGNPGSCEARMNQAEDESVVLVSATGDFEASTGSSNVSRVTWEISGTTNGHRVDDIHILDTAGPVPLGDFIGDGRIYHLRPEADVLSNWTPLGGGTNFSELDETPRDDADFVFSTTEGDKDRYDLTNLPVGPEGVHFAVVNTRTVNLTGAQTDFKTHLESQGNELKSPLLTVLTDHKWLQFPVDQDPATSVRWLRSGIDGARIGHEIVV